MCLCYAAIAILEPTAETCEEFLKLFIAVIDNIRKKT